MSKRLVIFFGQLWCMAVALHLLSCQPKGGSGQEEIIAGIEPMAENAIPVEGVPVRMGTFEIHTPLNGVIESGSRSELAFTVSGQLFQLKVRNGQKVEKGQLIAVLDDQAFRIDYKLAEDQFRAAEAELRSLVLGYTGGKTSDTLEFDKNLLQSLKVQSGYNRALLQLQQAEFRLKATVLKAPMAGVVCGLSMQAPSYITVGQSLGAIVDLSNLIVLFKLIETEYSRLRHIKRVIMNMKMNDGAAQVVQGEIIEVDPRVDAHGLITVKARLNLRPDAQAALPPLGQNVQLMLVEEIPNRLIVPKSALLLRNNRQVMFTVKKGRSKWVYVDVLHENADHLAISGELNVGDTVIINGHIHLGHDAKVRLVQAP